MKKLFHGINSTLVHTGESPDPTTGAVVPPIYQTSTFAFPTNESIWDLMEGRREGFIYTRYGNPNYGLVEAKIAALEGAENALVLASGMAATSTAILAQVQAGDHVISHADIYGGSFGLFYELLPRLGIETSFVDVTDTDEIDDAIRPNTRVIFVESPSNPTLRVSDLRAIAALAHTRGILFMVDNTFATPYNQQPLALGADVVVHSGTKYLNGHSDVMAGVIVGQNDYIDRCVQVFRKLGGTLNAIDSWLFNRGLKTFGLRMERHNQNGQAVAKFLAQHPRIKEVHFPGLRTHPQHQLAEAQMSGFGGVLSVGNYLGIPIWFVRIKVERQPNPLKKVRRPPGPNQKFVISCPQVAKRRGKGSWHPRVRSLRSLRLNYPSFMDRDLTGISLR